jgi:hypothetical protein
MAPRNEIVPELNQAFEVSGGICNYFRNCDGEEQELWLAASMSKNLGNDFHPCSFARKHSIKWMEPKTEGWDLMAGSIKNIII